VIGPDGERLPGLLAQWQQSQDGAWAGLVVYAVDETDGQVALVQAWIPAEQLRPVDRDHADS
jgi:hypothetical protein